MCALGFIGFSESFKPPLYKLRACGEEGNTWLGKTNKQTNKQTKAPNLISRFRRSEGKKIMAAFQKSLGEGAPGGTAPALSTEL